MGPFQAQLSPLTPVSSSPPLPSSSTWHHLETFLGFPGGLNSKESACNTGDLGLIPEWADPLEMGMATHSSVLAWRIPWTKDPGGLQSMGSQRVRHN